MSVPRPGAIQVLLGLASYDSKLNRFWFKLQWYVHMYIILPRACLDCHHCFMCSSIVIVLIHPC